MSWQLQAHAAFETPRMALSLLRPSRLACILCLGGAAQGCAGTPISPFSPDPTDASVRVPTVSYRSTTGRFTRKRPVEPSPWEEPAAQTPRSEHQ
jgi:hypothetical protein